jgi:hypothetical protein
MLLVMALASWVVSSEMLLWLLVGSRKNGGDKQQGECRLETFLPAQVDESSSRTNDDSNFNIEDQDHYEIFVL